MIAALKRLKESSQPQLPKALAVFGIDAGRFGTLFMSHPPVDERIEALRNTPRV